jgi:4-alpha-glucanotransferase
VFEKAYKPMVELLERHPGVRSSLHYSGPLLQWLRQERPGFLDAVRALVDRGQVELLGGGYYEPVLASLPERDRVSQLVRMADELEALIGHRPVGAWLAERVWEPSLPTSLVDAGYRWTIVDDVHLRAAAIPDAEHWSAYTTEDQGRGLTVFGTEQGLRYLIPFQGVHETIEHLRAHATPEGNLIGMMGDDGEKFGSWPTTYEHCWGRGEWMERLFGALESNADWLTTVTPTAWLAQHGTAGRVYLPTSSYAEMTEWALPPDQARIFAAALHEAIDQRRPYASFLRGGFWRNFQRRYREINDLHKQMLRTSAKVDAMAAGLERSVALDHLLQGQSNDCYWHGLFGGVYLSHMRLATFEHLIAAEDAADRTAVEAGRRRERSGVLADVDVDGVDEIIFEAPGQVVTIKLDEGAGIAEWDVRSVRHALAAVMRRRPEAYHARLINADRVAAARVEAARVATEQVIAERIKVEIQAVAAPAGAQGEPLAVPGTAESRAVGADGADGAAGADGGAATGEPGASGVESIHEIVSSKEPGLAGLLFYDGYERRSGLVHFLDPGVTPRAFIEADFEELGDFVDQAFELVELTDSRLVARRDGALVRDGVGLALRVTKTLTIGGDRAAPTLTLSMGIENRSDESIDVRLCLEWNLTFLGGGGNPAAFYLVDGERRAHDSAGRTGESMIRSGNDDLGVALTTTISPAGETWWAPIETVSNSESGFERVYQGSSLAMTWPLRLEPGGRWESAVHQAIETTRDRAAEEAARRAAATGGGA